MGPLHPLCCQEFFFQEERMDEFKAQKNIYDRGLFANWKEARPLLIPVCIKRPSLSHPHCSLCFWSHLTFRSVFVRTPIPILRVGHLAPVGKASKGACEETVSRGKGRETVSRGQGRILRQCQEKEGVAAQATGTLVQTERFHWRIGLGAWAGRGRVLTGARACSGSWLPLCVRWVLLH